MYSLAFSFWESSNGITWLPLYCRDPSTPGSTLARVIVYFFEKLTRVLTGSVKEQGQILISLHRSSRVVFLFFLFKDLRKGRYICLIIQVSWHLWSAGKPSVCIDQKGKKNLQTWSSSAVFDNHFFIGSCFTEVGGKLIFKCAPFSPSMRQEHLSLLWQASPIAIVQYSDGTVLAIKVR